VISALPVTPSTVADTVELPGVKAETSPSSSTLATPVWVQVTVLPWRLRPSASFGAAVSCRVFPALSESADGVTSTVTTGLIVTVISAEAFLPPTTATMVAEPAAAPSTVPVVSTLAAAMLVLLQATRRPVITRPAESRAIASSWRVSPWGRVPT
jgi:hypothetical protein